MNTCNPVIIILVQSLACDHTKDRNSVQVILNTHALVPGPEVCFSEQAKGFHS